MEGAVERFGVDHFPSAVPALQATILHLPGSGPTISLLLSSLNVGLRRMKVHTCTPSARPAGFRSVPRRSGGRWTGGPWRSTWS